MRGKNVAIIGGGPAGLMAAEVLGAAGCAVTVYEAMPTLGRKFLLAGKSGLNITHSEDFDIFRTRFLAASERLGPALDAFTPDDIRAWASELGTETFVGSSGRVFPTAMKASPLLRAWLARLEGMGVRLLKRHRWMGFEADGLALETPEGRIIIRPDATLLALGGASWPRLGSDAAWVPWLHDKGIQINPFKPSNCGFDVAWSDSFRERFAGAPLKSVVTRSPAGTFQGEFVISRHGIEGSLVYAHSAALRDQIDNDGQAVLSVDLTPGRSEERLVLDLTRQGGKTSFSNRLRKGAGLEGVKAALLRELLPESPRATPETLAKAIKSLPIPLLRPRPIAEAISSAGGIAWPEIDTRFMLARMPGIFVAGEMIDWEAPTGGYLLTACLASGRAAGQGMTDWLSEA
ncbi:MAG: TIGR03862 family flavoprotein [Alphaproteobacteria bacterium]|nr:TIGR03862 family flavoprotein [Alphaproteobacteria bacterium]MBU1550302.1 TIGR03862 family flavoprotein [Alphaproteobacteria bacterium]MBU2337777.1 TIGR03862 family flavoprotein [Alphaproteobacteria bacterium]MBU2387757.1 TIGR03862 family flavoprotein [Alphaproteobacteria bacterium]